VLRERCYEHRSPSRFDASLYASVQMVMPHEVLQRIGIANPRCASAGVGPIVAGDKVTGGIDGFGSIDITIG